MVGCWGRSALFLFSLVDPYLWIFSSRHRQALTTLLFFGSLYDDSQSVYDHGWNMADASRRGLRDGNAGGVSVDG